MRRHRSGSRVRSPTRGGSQGGHGQRTAQGHSPAQVIDHFHCVIVALGKTTADGFGCHHIGSIALDEAHPLNTHTRRCGQCWGMVPATSTGKVSSRAQSRPPRGRRETPVSDCGFRLGLGLRLGLGTVSPVPGCDLLVRLRSVPLAAAQVVMQRPVPERHGSLRHVIACASKHGPWYGVGSRWVWTVRDS